MTSPKNGVVLVHGAWHDHHTWDAVVPLLEAQGVVAKAIDLPGAGANAAWPDCIKTRPMDPAACAREPSPNAGVTQNERTDAVIAAVREVNAETGGKAVILGHSLGGLTMTPVAEAIPDEISAVIYLCAFMLPPGMVAGQMIEDPSMARAGVTDLLMADPEVVGALRFDVRTDDAQVLAAAHWTFGADVPFADFKAGMAQMHPDEPAQVVGTPSAPTAARFGTVPRHYIACEHDNAIPIEGQEKMIDLMDAAMGNATQVHRLSTSHSPFHSAIDDLAHLIEVISCTGFGR